jgi:hypothetical protein
MYKKPKDILKYIPNPQECRQVCISSLSNYEFSRVVQPTQEGAGRGTGAQIEGAIVDAVIVCVLNVTYFLPTKFYSASNPNPTANRDYLTNVCFVGAHTCYVLVALPSALKSFTLLCNPLKAQT